VIPPISVRRETASDAVHRDHLQDICALADEALQQAALNIEQKMFCSAFSFHRVLAMLSYRWSRLQTQHLLEVQ
jgi:hypothetical protein